MNTIGPEQIGGLPAHILLVHLTVVLLPTAAAATVASAAWPTARRRLGIVTPLLALAALICVPITVNAGEWLYARVQTTPLIARHEKLGHGLLPWAIALFAVAVIEYVWFNYTGTQVASDGGAHSARTRTRPVVTVVATVLALVVSVGTVIEVYRIGDSGSRAVWEGGFSETPLPANPG
jgi:hypothetical protein